MKQVFAATFFSLVAAQASAEPVEVYDHFLAHVVRAYDLKPLPTKPFETTAKYKLGQMLFFDPILSGNRDISCGTCHLLDRGTSDGLDFSIGTGGSGLGERRTLPDGRPQQPRNALDLSNRDNNWVKAMFWDGRVEALDPIKKTFRSPLGDELPSGLENTMAVQALFPLAQEDEMLGLPGDRSPSSLPGPHADQENEIARATAHLHGATKIQQALDLVMTRLLGDEDQSFQPWQRDYRKLFHDAYPQLSAQAYSIVEVANALAHFEEIAFATRATPWDRYLAGDPSGIAPAAKRGAFLFFGKGRCAVCHSGPLFSDFRYHSIGVKSHGPGYDGDGEDLGRYRVTGFDADRYKFRTPPLRNVTRTAPYFHNGSATTLEEAIRQHLDPLYYADKYDETGAHAMTLAQIDSVSPILTLKTALHPEDVAAIIEFLSALEDEGPTNVGEIVPISVPSGLPVQNEIP